MKNCTNKLRVLPGFNCQCVYRFFSEKWHAEELISGKVWITTLEECRKVEPPRGDPNEGKLDYQSGEIVEDSDNPDLQLIAKRLRIGFKGKGIARNIQLRNNTVHSHIPDAFVLCMTEKFQSKIPGIGEYCVKISNPKEFFWLVTQSLKTEKKVTGSWLGHIHYAEPAYVGTEPQPGPLGFVKPPDVYKGQKEIRALWTVDKCDYPLKPFSLPCPDITKFCSLVTSHQTTSESA